MSNNIVKGIVILIVIIVIGLLIALAVYFLKHDPETTIITTPPPPPPPVIIQTIPPTTAPVINLEYIPVTISQFKVPDFARLSKPKIRMEFWNGTINFKLEPGTYLPHGLLMETGHATCVMGDLITTSDLLGYTTIPTDIIYDIQTVDPRTVYVPNNAMQTPLTVDLQNYNLQAKSVLLATIDLIPGTYLPNGLKVNINKAKCLGYVMTG